MRGLNLQKNNQTNLTSATAKSKGLKKLAIHCKRFLPVIIFAIVFAIAGAVLTVIGPNKIGDLTDEILKGLSPLGIDFKVISSIGISLILIYSFSLVFSYVQAYLMARVTKKITKNLRQDILKKTNNLPLCSLDKKNHGEVLSIITNDVDIIGQTLNNSIASLLAGVVLLFGSVIMMFVTNWILAICAIVASLIGFSIMAIIMLKSQKYFKSQQNILANMNGHVEEYYSAHSIVKLYNAQNQTKKDFNKINENLKKQSFKAQFYSGLMMPLMSFVGNLGYVVVCVVGAVLVTNKTIDISVIVSFMIYIRLFTQPLGTIAQSMTSLQSAKASSERVFDFLELTEMENDDNKKALPYDEIKGNIEFSHVSFGYEKNKKIIKDFTTQIKAGQKVAIVGPTGGGKTTIVNLLMKFYEIDEGDILIDGESIHSLQRNNVQNMFSMVLQDTWIFEGSVLENILYSTPNKTIEDVKDVCKKIGIDHFIKTLSNGYDTVLNQQVSLSQGQKQLITIARAMIQNSPMLILDEATSSVDTRTEIQIQKAMDNLSTGKTSFVIAHRLSTIKNADIILVLKDGNIIEQGNHENLLKQNGFYTNLYNSQFERGSQ